MSMILEMAAKVLTFANVCLQLYKSLKEKTHAATPKNTLDRDEPP